MVLDTGFDPETFVGMAIGFTVDGPLQQACDVNSKVAMELGEHQRAATWRILGLLFGDGDGEAPRNLTRLFCGSGVESFGGKKPCVSVSSSMLDVDGDLEKSEGPVGELVSRIRRVGGQRTHSAPVAKQTSLPARTRKHSQKQPKWSSSGGGRRISINQAPGGKQSQQQALGALRRNMSPDSFGGKRRSSSSVDRRLNNDEDGERGGYSSSTSSTSSSSVEWSSSSSSVRDRQSSATPIINGSAVVSSRLPSSASTTARRRRRRRKHGKKGLNLLAGAAPTLRDADSRSDFDEDDHGDEDDDEEDQDEHSRLIGDEDNDEGIVQSDSESDNDIMGIYSRNILARFVATAGVGGATTGAPSTASLAAITDNHARYGSGDSVFLSPLMLDDASTIQIENPVERSRKVIDIKFNQLAAGGQVPSGAGVVGGKALTSNLHREIRKFARGEGGGTVDPGVGNGTPLVPSNSGVALSALKNSTRGGDKQAGDYLESLLHNNSKSLSAAAADKGNQIACFARWKHADVVYDMLEFYSSEGEVQMCVCVSLVLEKYLEVEMARLEGWVFAYLEMLRRFKLWSVCAGVVLACKGIAGVGMLSQVRSGVFNG
jgi:hypothetical protein